MLHGIEYRNEISKHLDIGKEILFINESQVRGLKIADEKVIELTERALSEYSKRKVEMPAKIGIHPLKDTLMHAMPCNIPSMSSCGIKWGTCYPDNMERFGLIQTACTLIYNDRESGYPISYMDANWITERRTSAVSCVAAKYMAPSSAETFGMVGCGVQGVSHTEMIPLVLKNLKKIYLFDIREEAIDSLIEIVQPKWENIEFIKCQSLEEIYQNALVVVTAAKITEKPLGLVEDSWIHEGQTLISCDCHTFYQDTTIKRVDRYYCDSIEQHRLLEDYGYYPDGLPKIFGETGEIPAGLKSGREDSEQIIFANNVGMAVEDMMLARLIFDKAIEENIGTKLKL